LILIDEATLLVRVRAPPETWTTRLEPLGQPEPALVDHLFGLVTIFSNDCSKFEHPAKWLGIRHCRLQTGEVEPGVGKTVERADLKAADTPAPPGYFRNSAR